MASYTTRLNLKKPSGSENVSIQDINGNMDIIDNAYGAVTGQLQHYYDTDGKLYRLSSNADLDSITESGRYYFGANVTNKPASGGGYLDVYAYDTSWIKQVAYLEGSDAMYVRTKTGSSWSSWNDQIGNLLLVEDRAAITAGTNINFASGDLKKQAKMGNVAVICMSFTPSANISAGAAIVTGLIPSYNNRSIVMAYDNSASSSPVRLSVDIGGVVNTLDSLTSGHSYRLFAVYPCIA